mmetsp:Transcript_53515/g.165874  ORF Transcript_53515/g.165874 Transcript_53515/m.165874 type:complete len:83 (+) Transcript_53515:226-474(+)
MDFEPSGGGPLKVCFFERRFLGLGIASDMPLRIDLLAPEGPARACGLEPGWRVVRIGDVVVGNDMDREQLLAYIVAGSAHLP